MENLRVGMTSELVMKNTFLGESRRKNMQKMRRKQAIKNMRAQGDMGDQGVFEVSTKEEAMASRIASKQPGVPSNVEPSMVVGARLRSVGTPVIESISTRTARPLPAPNPARTLAMVATVTMGMALAVVMMPTRARAPCRR